MGVTPLVGSREEQELVRTKKSPPPGRLLSTRRQTTYRPFTPADLISRMWYPLGIDDKPVPRRRTL